MNNSKEMAVTGNLIHNVQSQLDSEALETLSRLLEAPIPQTRLGASTAIPVLLSSITQFGSSSGLELVTERLQKIDPNKVSNLGTALSIFGEKLIMGGSKMLELLVGDSGPMTKAIAEYSNLDEVAASRLLSAFTPILMGTIRRELGENDPVTMPQVQQYLASQADTIARALPQVFLEHAKRAGLELVPLDEVSAGTSASTASKFAQDEESLEAESSKVTEDDVQPIATLDIERQPARIEDRLSESQDRLSDSTDDEISDEVAATFGHLKPLPESDTPAPDTTDTTPISAAEAARAKLATITRVDSNGTTRNGRKTPVPDKPKEVTVRSLDEIPAKPSASQWLSDNALQETWVDPKAEDGSVSGFHLFPFRKYLLIALGVALLLYLLLGILRW